MSTFTFHKKKNITNRADVVRRKIIRDGLFDVNIQIGDSGQGLSLLDLPFEPIWYITIITVAYIQSCTILLEIGDIFASRKCVINNYNTFTILDFLIPIIDFGFGLFNLAYFMDVCLIIIGKYVDHNTSLVAPTLRPKSILTLEILATIPFYNLVTTESAFYEPLLFLQALKIVRVIYHFHIRLNKIKISLFYRTLQLILSAAYVSCLALAATYNLYELFEQENVVAYKRYNLYLLLEKLSAWGFVSTKNDFTLEVVIILFVSVDVLIVKAILLTIIGNEFIILNRQRYMYHVKMNQVFDIMSYINVPKSYLSNAIMHYHKMWIRYQGYNYTTKAMGFVPESLQNEISLDITCVAFKHSKIFRNVSISVMRSLAKLAKKHIYQRNEYIYQRGELKSRMIYIVSGIIEIMSEEDCQTPIMSLSSGTCLGESTLFCPYISQCVIKCQTHTEVLEVHAVNFLKLSVLFKETFNVFRAEILKRYDEARELNNISNYFKGEMTYQRGDYSMIWIKYMSRQILRVESEFKKNIFMGSEIKNVQLEKMIFSTKYLDLLVLTTSAELNRTSEFFVTKFPFILNPNGLLAQSWEAVIMILVFCALVLLPKYIFAQHIPLLVMGVFRIINYSFFLDILMQSFIAVKTPDAIITKTSQILRYKCATLGYTLDILAGLPLEMFNCIIVKNSSGYSVALLRLNKLFKVWRLVKLSNYIHNKFNINLLVTFNVVLLTMTLYLIYFWTQLLRASNCNFPPYECADDREYKIFFSVTQLVTGVGLRAPHDAIYHLGLIEFLCYSSSSVFVLLIVMYIGSTYILQESSYLLIETLKLDLISKFEIYKIDKELQSRLFNLIAAEIAFDKGIGMTCERMTAQDMPTDDFKLILQNEYMRQLKQLQYFAELPEELVFKICELVDYHIFPPNEFICKAGDVAIPDIYILSKGVCRYVTAIDSSESNGLEIINSLTNLLGIPMPRTCVTITHCLVLSINYLQMRDVLVKHFKYMFDMKEVLLQKKETRDVLLRYSQVNEGLDLPYKSPQEQSFVVFDRKAILIKDSIEEYDYFIPFDNVTLGHLIQRVLMKRTIIPNGTFMNYWETSRSIFAVMTGFTYGSILLAVSTKPFTIIFRLLLNIMAYVDIYVRLHVCYYNDDGILVSHPLSTAKNYLVHDFLCDLFAVLPLNMLVDTRTSHVAFLLYSNRLLQMRRFFGFLKYHQSGVNNLRDKYFRYTIIPGVMLLCVYFGSFLCTLTCEFGPNVPVNRRYFRGGVFCQNQSVFVNSQFGKPLSPTTVQLYGIYIAASVFTTVGIQGFVLDTYKEGMFCTVLALLGIVCSMTIISRTLLHYTRSSFDLPFFQTALRNLKEYMSLKRVDNFIRSYVMQYYEFRWKRERGRNFGQILRKFHYTLKQEILYETYGEAILKSSIFPDNAKMFVKQVLLHTIHESILMDATIASINDITSKLYIVYKGIVIIYLPDGTQLDVIGQGGIFGNLDNTKYSRLKVVAVAHTHVELLHLRAQRFHKVISNWPALYALFNDAKSMYMYYLPAAKVEELHDDVVHQIKRRRSAHFLHTARNCLNNVYDANSLFVEVWSNLNVISCYLSIILYVTQLAFTEFSNAFVACQYASDAVYYVYTFYIATHTSFEDDRGVVVRDLAIIRKRHVWQGEKVLLFVVQLPYDLLVYSMPAHYHIRKSLFKVLRANRLLRYKTISRQYVEQNHRVSQITYIKQVVHLMTIILMIIHVLACCMVFACTFVKKNMSVVVPQNLHELPIWEKVKIYTTYYYMVITCVARLGIDSHAPQSNPMIIATVVLIIICPILYGIIYSRNFLLIFNKIFLRKLFHDKVNALMFLLKKQEISGQIIAKTYRYIQLVWYKHEGILRPHLLSIAPAHMQDLINCATYSFHLNNHFVFGKCHVDFKRQLCNHIDFDLYLDGDYITFKRITNGTMYIIRKGQVEVFDEDDNWNEVSVKTLTATQTFGLVQGLKPEVPQEYSYKAKVFSVVMFLKFDNWKYLLEFFPASQEIIYDTLNHITVDMPTSGDS